MSTPALPWWDFSRIDDFGTIDPAGPYWKPDSNIQIPGNYPVVAALPGTITSVRQTSWGETAITVKLDSPINSLATHTFYEHLGSATVQPGQHVGQGDLIGYNNPPGQVPLGFGFYSGDVYGQGADWGILQQDLAPGGAGLLNPVAFLNAMKAGTATPTVGMGGVPPQSDAATQAAVNTTLGSFAQRAGIFLLSLVLVGAGAFLLFKNQIEGAAKKGVEVAAA